jgi:gas vesicle protein
LLRLREQGFYRGTKILTVTGRDPADFRPAALEIKKEVKIMRYGRYESSDSNSIGTAVTFLLIGIGAGALAALVLAPKTGKQFRRDLKRGYEDARDTLQDWKEETRDRVKDVKERVRDAAERGADIAEEMRGKVEPLRRAINRL